MLCDSCDNNNPEYVCGDCFVTTYCNNHCQKKDWMKHSMLCGSLVSETEKKLDKLHLKVIETRDNKLFYYVDEDRFVDGYEKEMLLEKNPNLIEKSDFHLLFSKKHLLYYKAYLYNLQKLMAKRIFFSDNPKLLKQGSCIDQYFPVKVIGGGNQGLVFLLCDDFSCDTVVKVNPYRKDDSEKEAMFYKQASDLNVAPYFYDSFECDDLYFIITDRYDGDLFQLLIKLNQTIDDKYTQQDAIDVLSQAFNHIYVLLQNNIVHRDTKACNFLYDNNNTVKIADFGISKYMDIKPDQISSYLLDHIVLFMRSLKEPITYGCSENLDDPLNLSKNTNPSWEYVFQKVFSNNLSKWNIKDIPYLHNVKVQ